MVKDFTVYNQYGKIKFDEPVDVRELDLDNLVHINSKTVNKSLQDICLIIYRLKFTLITTR